MKKMIMLGFAGLCLFAAALLAPATTMAQKNKSKLLAEASAAKADLIKSDEGLANLFKNAFGYVIFPNVGKGALIVGGAGGKGVVYEGGKATGWAKVTQVTVGAQAGGQAYREVIFFQTKEAMDRFKDDKLEVSAQMSAVAVKSGASANAKYTDGVLIFTEEIGGLMAEASIGGQKFSFKPFSRK